MRSVMTALFVALATQVNAFDIDLDDVEIRRLKSEYLVDDLSVGVKAVIETYDFCSRNNKLYVNRAAFISKNSKWRPNFEITLLPSGELEAVINPADDISSNSIPFPNTGSCDDEIKDLGFYPVRSIDGADNFSEFISTALANGYTMSNKKLAREMRSTKKVTKTYTEVFTDMYADKIKSKVIPCLQRLQLADEFPDDAKITVETNFDRKGYIVTSSLSLVDQSIFSDFQAEILYHGLRRAFLRCQKTGYALPEENYESWKSMQITFFKNELLEN